MTRRMDLRIAGLFALVLLLLSAMRQPWAVEAQDGGIVEGEVVNGTPAGPDVGAGIPVSLFVVEADLQVDVKETTTDASGRFRFEGLDTDETLEYWLEATYLQLPYSSLEPLQFLEGQSELEGQVTVYETGADDSGIRANLLVLRVQALDSVLRVQESYYLGNEGDRTFLGEAGELPDDQLSTAFIPLPDGQFGLELGLADGVQRAVEVDGGVAATEPIRPGEGTLLVSLSYHLAVPGSGMLSLERSVPFPVDAVWVLAAQPGLLLQSEMLESQGITELEEGQPVELFIGQELSENTPIVMELQVVAGASSSAMSGASATGAQTGSDGVAKGSQEVLGLLGIGVIALAVLAAVVYPLTSRRLETAPVKRPRLMAEPNARRLLAELADLEEARDAGQLDQVAYERQRSEKYQAIRSVWD